MPISGYVHHFTKYVTVVYFFKSLSGYQIFVSDHVTYVNVVIYTDG